MSTDEKSEAPMGNTMREWLALEEVQNEAPFFGCFFSPGRVSHDARLLPPEPRISAPLNLGSVSWPLPPEPQISAPE